MEIISKTSNPAFSEKIFSTDKASSFSSYMTLNGVINRSFIMLLLVICSFYYTWSMVGKGINVTGFILGGSIIGFILALVTIFKRKLSYITAPLYSIAQGLFLGGISAMINVQYPGLPMKAIVLTFGVFITMFFLYQQKIIKATNKFKSIIVTSIGGIFIAYLISWIMSFFGVESFIYGNSTFSIIFSLFVVGIASLSLILDFDFIEKGIKQGLPKYMEWYAAFGLMVTLIWLYLEILRLLTKLSSSNR